MGRNAVCTANPAGGIQRDEVCKRAASPVGLVQKGVSGAGKAGNLWQAAKLGTQLANSAVPAGSNPSFGQRVQNTILGSVLGMQNSKIVDFDIQEALSMKKPFEEELYHIAGEIAF